MENSEQPGWTFQPKDRPRLSLSVVINGISYQVPNPDFWMAKGFIPIRPDGSFPTEKPNGATVADSEQKLRENLSELSKQWLRGLSEEMRFCGSWIERLLEPLPACASSVPLPPNGSTEEPTVDSAGWVELYNDPGNLYAAEYSAKHKTYYYGGADDLANGDVVRHWMIRKPTI